MTPDDPRHGAYAGAVAHWRDGEKPCEPCRRAAGRVRKRNNLLQLVGSPATVDSVGTVRRIRALHAIGWTQSEIAAAAGISVQTLRNPICRGTRVYRATADTVALAYEQMHMTPAPESRNSRYMRTVSKREAYAPPLAWDDIDDPDEQPKGVKRTGDERLSDHIDEVAVDRFLAGEKVATNYAERLEITRRWVADEMPTNTESWFVSRSLRMLPPRIVVSYADLAHGHAGHVYRALNFRYAGWTDMDRKTPRMDYLPSDPSKHTRESSRSGIAEKRRRVPKVRYWTTTGTPTDRRALAARCGWPSLDWRTTPPPEQAAA